MSKAIFITALLVLCSASPVPAASFTDNGNGTITDNKTGLMWQKQDDAATKTWEQALSYCEGLSLDGYTNWRLPNVKELSSIVDDTRYGPAINTVYFPNTQSSYYWSSTSDAYSTPTFAWRVNFNTGDVDGYYKTDLYYVRCLR